MKTHTFLALGFLVLFACQKNDSAEPVKPLEAVTVKNVAADPVTIDPATGRAMGGTNRFTLFSFKENKTIANADSASNKWDIGFRGTTIIVNGGAIRTGQGGAYLHTGLFEELKQIPDNQVFNTDQSATQLAIPTSSGTGWYNYNAANNWISPIAGKILVIKTGEGKFAKVEILNYYKDAPATPSPTAVARHYTFRFLYQPDGSRKF